MSMYSYKIEHDFGLAPNPFLGTMTLAVCKGDIRNHKKLQIGDWIIGTGSQKLKNLNHLIYAMRVDEKMTFDAYWDDPRFEIKRPQMKGSLAQIYGDNFYHTVDGEVVQEFSTHSNQDGTPNMVHQNRDWAGKYVLISNHFYYFGDMQPVIPQELRDVCCKGRDYCYRGISDELKAAFIKWLEDNYEPGIHGEPINWRQYKRPAMGISDEA